MKPEWIGLLLVVTAAVSRSQSLPLTPKFEVASIRECDASGSRSQVKSTPGRLTLNCWPLERIVVDAYQIFAGGKVDPRNPDFPLAPVEGGPDWMRSVSYSINAITAEPQSLAMMRGPIMQKFLEDRFRLRAHRETRETAVYVMTVARDGPKLQATKEGTCSHLDSADLGQSMKLAPGAKPWCVVASPVKNGSHYVWDVNGMGMELLSARLHVGDLPVIDRTGLTGVYDIHLEWDYVPPDPAQPNAGVASDPAYAPIIAAIRKQLGLDFTRGKGPREFFVIDKLERPSGN